MIWTLALDGLVAILLIVTIAVAVILDRRLAALRRDRNELAALSHVFEQAMAHADDGVARLKVSTEALLAIVNRSESLRDDLSFLIERAAGAADRLEAGIKMSRPKKEAWRPDSPLPSDAEPVDPTPRPSAARGNGTKVRSSAERELLKALQIDR
jgi:hypothetical protein